MTDSCHRFFVILILNLNGGNRMKKIYIYVLDTMADWELGWVLSAMSVADELKEQKYQIQFVSAKKDMITTIGGMQIIPECTTEDMEDNACAALLLPGAQDWTSEKHQAILKKVEDYLYEGKIVGAICGATLALSEIGLLNHLLHTSNSLEYLKFFSKHYAGEALYRKDRVVSHKNLITAGSASSLMWAKEIMQELGVLPQAILDPWYHYFDSGELMYYLQMMEEIAQANQ